MSDGISAKPLTDRELQKLSFEDALQRLEQLVAKIEEGKLPLEELSRGFEEGRKLAGFCRGKLNSLEKKIEILLHDDGQDGEWSLFDTGEKKPPSGARRNTSTKKNPQVEEDSLL